MDGLVEISYKIKIKNNKMYWDSHRRLVTNDNYYSNKSQNLKLS